jgi:hypothetical protein
MGIFISKNYKPENIKNIQNYGIEVTYYSGHTLNNIKKYDKKIKTIAKKYKIKETATDFNMKENIRSIQFEDKFENKNQVLQFIKNIPKEYKISILFISYIDTNDNYDVWHMIFYNKKINPDFSWLSKEDKEIYDTACKLR